MRSLSFSIATTLPMFGAMSPSAAAGLRPIWAQVCASECTSAHALMERTRAMSPKCCPSLGKMPTGQFTLLIMVGLIRLTTAALRSLVTFRFQLSRGLVAPVSRMKMQFLAVFFVAMFCETIPAGAGADWPIR